MHELFHFLRQMNWLIGGRREEEAGRERAVDLVEEVLAGDGVALPLVRLHFVARIHHQRDRDRLQRRVFLERRHCQPVFAKLKILAVGIHRHDSVRRVWRVKLVHVDFGEGFVELENLDAAAKTFWQRKILF